eukprot:gene14143-15620_t
MPKEQKQFEWVQVALKRFKTQLPYQRNHRGLHSEDAIKLVQQSLINLAEHQYSMIVTSLATFIHDVNYTHSLSSEPQDAAVQSNILVLETLHQCFKKYMDGNASLSDDVVSKQLLPIVCPLVLQQDGSSLYQKMHELGGKIVSLISRFHFTAVFTRIMKRISHLCESGEDGTSTSVDDIEIIKHLHVNRKALIAVLTEVVKFFKLLKKHSQLALVKALDQLIWNWIENYPEQFSALYKDQNSQLSDVSDKLFILVDAYSEATKKRTATWPLQVMVLLLCQQSVREAAGNGELSKGQNYVKRNFLENLKKALVSGSKGTAESAVIACVQLCKASTFITREDNVVCFLVAEVLNELKALLFNPHKAFPSPTGLSSIDLMTDCFVASFRINFRNNQHFEVCFHVDSPAVFQLACVKGLHRIVKEKPLRWWPKIDVLYSKATQLRVMFQASIKKVASSDHLANKSTHIRSSMVPPPIARIRDRKKEEEMTQFQREAELLYWIVKLFNADPLLALHNPEKAGHEIQASSMQFIDGLVTVAMSNEVPEVSTEAAETMLCLHSPDNVELWNPEAPIATFWEISSHVIFNIAERLQNDKNVNQAGKMKWLQKILRKRVQFLTKNKDQAAIGTHISICTEALSKLETIFLVSLWSSELDIVQLAIECFALMHEEAGRTALQKRIMSILKQVNVATSGNLEAWELTLNRWYKLTNALIHYPTKEFPPIESSKASAIRKGQSGVISAMPNDLLEIYIAEWTNMTGFLCSLGGICVATEDPGQMLRTTSVMSQKSFHGANTNPGFTDTLPDSTVNRMISQMLTLLVCNNEQTALHIRNGVKEPLGADLSPLLYKSFFTLCKATTQCFFPDGQVDANASNTVYVEQILYILKTMLDTKSDEVISMLGYMPVEELVLPLIKYVRTLPLKVQCLIVKAKMCQLVESLMARRSELSFRQEMKFRNKIVEYLTEWVLHASTTVEEVPPEILAISCTLDEAAMKAIVVLLKNLPLQPETVESDIVEAKSCLFLKYFTLFMNILNKCYEVQDYKEAAITLAPHYANLRGSTVQAMSNMLSANIDSGLMHSIGLGYHEDPQTRSTFMEVLTDILKQGTEFENLAETVLEDRFERLVNLVTWMSEDGDLPIAMALTNVTLSEQLDDLALVFVTIFDSKNMLRELFSNLFKQEVELAEGMQTLFRGNSLASKTMAYAFKLYGGSYLRRLLEPGMAVMVHDCESSYEVDPTRVEKNENIGSNAKNLLFLAQSLIDRLIDSAESFPEQLSILCYCLNKAVHERFPSNTYVAVASAVFLRFFNPAIVSPHTSNIIAQPPSDKMRRGLRYTSKIMQNLANHILFTKEPHMEVFNDFLNRNFARIHGFFAKVSTINSNSEMREDAFSLVSDSNVLNLHKLLWNKQEKIGQYLAINRDYKSVGRGPFERMVTLLAHLGPPDYQPSRLQKGTLWNRTSSMGSKFREFMTKHAGQNKDELQSIKGLQLFYQEGKSKAGNPVFYYIVRRYRGDVMNDEILIYHVLVTLQPVYGQPWDLVVDFTHSASDSRFKPETLAKAFAVLPEAQVKSLSVVYIYNINSSLRQYAKIHDRILSPLKGRTNIITVDYLTKFYDFISEEELKLPSSTTSLEDDLKIFPIQRINKGTVFVKVGPNSVQIQAAEKVKVLGYNCIINDVFYASEIEQATFHEDMLELHFTTGGPGLRFFSASAEQITIAVNHVMSRWKLSQPVCKTVTEKKIRPKDVPGTLLNMGLLNLGSKDPGLRLAAYNLLCALTATFNLHIEERLLEAKGLCIPANNTMFIKSISQQLAKREPNMTLEFLDECINGFSMSDFELKHLCLEYMAPWLPNLTKFCKCVSENPSRVKLGLILDKLIQLTIDERQSTGPVAQWIRHLTTNQGIPGSSPGRVVFLNCVTAINLGARLNPSIQAKVWGNIGKLPELLDVVLDSFMKTSTTGGLGSVKAEVMADTAVALATANVSLVSSKIIGRLQTVLGRTNMSPTPNLERHLMWDDIAILSRYLLMLSFNNCLNVASHLPDIFHVITLLVSTGPVSMKASIHGLVINSLQSLLTCSGIHFKGKTQKLLKTRLEEYSQQKFYLLFGISKVKSAPAKAFHSSLGRNRSRTYNSDSEDDSIALTSMETITDSLLEIIEACMSEIPNCNWSRKWRELATGFAFTHNPALQSRSIIVLGCISREVDDTIIRNLLQVLVKAVSIYNEPRLVESVIICLAKLQPLLPKGSRFHKALFWIAIGILQLSELNLFPAGLVLLDRSIETLDNHGVFDKDSIEDALMAVRTSNSLDWVCKQMDHVVGLSFNTNFNFALAAHVLKGLRHPSAKTKSAAVRILNVLLNICKKHKDCKDKFIVTKETIPYLAGLLAISSEVRTRLHASSRTSVFFKSLSKNPLCSSMEDIADSTRVSIVISPPTEVSEKPSSFVWPADCHNLILDPGVLDDTESQALLLVLLATLTEFTTDDAEARILYGVLAEASIVFQDVFPITFSILNRKLCNVLTHCEDSATLAAVHTIVQSTSAMTIDKSSLNLQYLSSIHFYGLHTFPGPFVQVENKDPAIAPHMFSRLVNAFVEEYKPGTMSPDMRSSSMQFFKQSQSIDNAALVSTTSSASLNAIPSANELRKAAPFHRAGSLTPSKRSTRKDRKKDRETVIAFER